MRLERSVLVLLFTLPALAGRFEDVTFRHQMNLPASESVYVLGDLAELGGGNLAQSVRLGRGTGDNWSVVVRLPVNRTYNYTFYRRFNDMQSVGNPGHGTLVAGPFMATTSTRALAPIAKRMLCHTALPNAVLHWRQDGGAWQSVPLADLGPGRTGGERLREAAAFGLARRPADFYLTDGSGMQPDPPSGFYQSPLDGFFLQDGHVFPYWPAASVGEHRRDYTPASPPFVHSSILGEDRGYRAMLPRGYDAHPSKRYPVIYFHDGPWMFDPNSPLYFNDAIDLDGNTTGALVRQGVLGECILIGIDWGTVVPQTIERNRARDYLPPGDGEQFPFGFVQGQGDRYAAFLKTELKPAIDSRYRTRPDPDSTFTAGFSYGGVVAAYLGWDHGETFHRVGCFSASFWIANFPLRLRSEPLRPYLRTYLDSGFDNYDGVALVRDNWISRTPPHVLEGDLRYVYRSGHQHTPSYVNLRLPEFGSFLYPASEEPNEFTYTAVPYGTSSGPEPLVLAWIPAGNTHEGAVRAAPAAGMDPWSGFLVVSQAPADTSVGGIRVLVDLGPRLVAVVPIASQPDGRFDLPLDLRLPAAAGLAVFAQIARSGAQASASNALEAGFAR